MVWVVEDIMTFYGPLANLINQLKFNLGFQSTQQLHLKGLVQDCWTRVRKDRILLTSTQGIYHWTGWPGKTHSSRYEPTGAHSGIKFSFATANKYILHNNLNGTRVAVLCEIIAGTMNDRFCSADKFMTTSGATGLCPGKL